MPLAVLAALSARGRLRAAWLTFAIGLSTWALGDVVSGYYAVILGREPFPSWADAGHLAYIPIVVDSGAVPEHPKLARSGPNGSRRPHPGRLHLRDRLARSDADRVAQRRNQRAGFRHLAGYPAGDVLIVTVCILVLLRVLLGCASR